MDAPELWLLSTEGVPGIVPVPVLELPPELDPPLDEPLLELPPSEDEPPLELPPVD